MSEIEIKLSGRAELRLRVKSTLEVTFHAGKIQSAVMKSLFVVEVVKQRFVLVLRS